MNNKILKKILEAASMAPSGDNVQPWKFQVSNNFTTIDLYNLPEKDNSYYNFNQMASYIAHGAVIENILIASRHLGCHAELSKLFPDEKQQNLIVRIDLSAAEPQTDALYPAIFERCTNRFQYQREEITEESIEKLSNSVKKFDTVNISLVNQKDKIKSLAKVLMVNDRLVFERKDIHGFLFDKIRWNNKQIEETRDGMPVEVMGLNPIEKLCFPLMRFWRFVKTANYFGLSRVIGLKCWWNCRNASILGMISTEGNDKYAFIQGGRAMQRLWLQATVQGFVFQPIIGLTLLINRLKQNELQGFSTEHSQMVINAAQSIPQKFEISTSDMLIMGFRAGSGGSMGVKTKRRKVEIKGL